MAVDFSALDDRATHIISTLIALLVAALYTFVGSRLAKRQVSAESQLAANMFSIWWYGLAALTLVGGVTSLLSVVGVYDVAAYVTATHLLLIILCVALAGLLYYLVFLFTGSRRALTPVVLFYVFFYICLVAFVTYQNPVGVDVKRWNTTIHYDNPITGPPVTILVLLLLLPIVFGALAYFSLFFRVHDRSQRYRIALVAGTITLWFSASLVASFTGVGREDWWQFVSRLIGVAAALLILWAYDPPNWVQRYLGVRSVVNGDNG